MVLQKLAKLFRGLLFGAPIRLAN